jgi:hypothetical protein
MASLSSSSYRVSEPINIINVNKIYTNKLTETKHVEDNYNISNSPAYHLDMSDFPPFNRPNTPPEKAIFKIIYNKYIKQLHFTPK